MDVERVLSFFGNNFSNATIEPISEGLINRTWKVALVLESYILQEINTSVFKDPVAISENIQKISGYLSTHHPGYLFPVPVSGRDGSRLVTHQGRFYRMFAYIEGSHTINTVTNVDEAFEAARQFGTFTALLNDFPVRELRLTIPEFHNLALRYQQFEQSLVQGNRERLFRASDLTDELLGYRHLLGIYEEVRSGTIPTRVIHHDTKISNVLFDDQGNGLCVIDLDTVMPGYFISDLGDMIRTYVSAANEEERDLAKIEIRMPVVEALLKGYLEPMGSLLSIEECDIIAYSGLFMTYMQAMRFLTDHFNDDSYYGAAYPDHNLVRAKNQLQLLRLFHQHEKEMQAIIKEILR